MQLLQPVTWQGMQLEELVEETTKPLRQVEHTLLLEARQAWQEGTRQMETQAEPLIEYAGRQLVQMLIPAEQLEQKVTLQRAHAPLMRAGLKGLMQVAQTLDLLQVWQGAGQIMHSPRVDSW